MTDHINYQLDNCDVVLTDSIIEFMQCDTCHSSLRSEKESFVWKCRYCINYGICNTCYESKHIDHAHYDMSMSDLFFRRDLWAISPSFIQAYNNTQDTQEQYKTFNGLWLQAIHKYRTRKWLGIVRGEKKSIVWYTYDTMLQYILCTAYKLMQHEELQYKSHNNNNNNTCECKPFTLLLVLPNSIEWVIIFFACLIRHILIIPVESNTSQEELTRMLHQVKPHFLVTHKNTNVKYDNTITTHIFVHDIVTYEHKQRTVPTDISIHTLLVPTHATCILTVTMTSGTTSGPKGVLVTDQMLTAKSNLTASAIEHDVVLASFVPFANATGRSHLIRSMCIGGQICIVSHPTALFDELPLIRPTLLSAPPSIWNIVRTMYESFRQVQSMTAKQAFEQVRAALGGNLKCVTIGGAKVNPSLLLFLQKCFGKGRAFEGYGASEVGMIARNGVLFSDVSVKLIDVPELGFLTTDQPYARGEICVRSPEMTSGYLLNIHQQQYFITIDNEMYYRTGDIGQLIPSPQRLFGFRDQIILLDRAKHFHKCSNGTFISPEMIEQQIERVCSTWLANIFLYFTSENENDIPVVILRVNPSSNANNTNFTCLIQDACQKIQLEPAFIPVIVHVDEGETSVDWFTSTGKKRRQHLMTYYHDQIESLLLLHRHNQQQQLSATTIHSNNNSNSIIVIQSKIIELLPHLSRTSWDEWKTKTFAELGGTSMEAMQLVQWCKLHMVHRHEQHAQSLLVSQLFQAVSIDNYIQFVTNKNVALVTSNIDWNLELQLPTVQNAMIQHKHNTSTNTNTNTNTKPKTCVMITGATGFLGRFVLAELMSMYEDLSIVCLIRPSVNVNNSRERLENVLRSDHLLADNVHLPDRIQIYTANVSEHRFGLSDEQYNALTETVSTVIHCAAKVHFILPYRDLRQDNVQATLNILQFCDEQTKKRLIYVSTASVLPYLNMPLNKCSSGYVCSKLVSEQHIIQKYNSSIVSENPLNDLSNVPSWFIIRPSAIAGHSQTCFGTPPPGDWITTIWREFATMGKLPVMSAQYPFPYQLHQLNASYSCIYGLNQYWKLIPVDIVAKRIIQSCFALNSIGSVITENFSEDIICVSPIQLCQMILPPTTDIIDVEQWKVFVNKLNKTHPLFPYRELLLHDTDTTTEKNIIQTTLLTTNQQNWLYRYFTNLLRFTSTKKKQLPIM